MTQLPLIPEATKALESEPDHLGHRERLRRRFVDTQGEGFADYELLELLLTLAIPRRDVKPLAKALIKRFGTFSATVSASADDLRGVEGIGESSVAALLVARVSALRLMRQQVMDRPILNSWPRLQEYLTADMAHRGIEHFRVLFLDRRNHLIADDVQQSGTVDHTPAYPREIVKRALEVGATAIILVHNHPSGDSTPSRADIETTKEIVRATAPVGITVHDHLIVSRGDTASFKTLGLL